MRLRDHGILSATGSNRVTGMMPPGNGTLVFGSLGWILEPVKLPLALERPGYDGDGREVRTHLAETLVAQEVKGLVHLNRPAYGAAELVALLDGLGGGAPGAGIQFGIAKILELWFSYCNQYKCKLSIENTLWTAAATIHVASYSECSNSLCRPRVNVSLG